MKLLVNWADILPPQAKVLYSYLPLVHDPYEVDKDVVWITIGEYAVDVEWSDEDDYYIVSKLRKGQTRAFGGFISIDDVIKQVQTFVWESISEDIYEQLNNMWEL